MLPPKKKKNKLLWIGLPILIVLIIIGAVVGGVLGSRKSSSGSDSSSGGNTGSGTGGSNVVNTVSAGVGSTATGANGQVILAVATDPYLLPVYPTATATSGYSAPSEAANPSSNGAWPADPSPPSTASPRAHPRLIAPGYKWAALQNGLIANDPYFRSWNATIIANATKTLSDPPKQYITDGGLSGSGVLDIAREIKLKVKNWSYAYRMTNNTAFVDRVYLELRTASGNNPDISFGANDGTRWNPLHFLDVAEFSSAFAIGYDWLYDVWTADQKTLIRTAIHDLGLTLGDAALSGASSASGYNWWTGTAVGNAPLTGNWNCVINGGLTMAALAILGDDTTGLATKVLGLTVPNAKANCMQAVDSAGTWKETANYWYFGTTGAAEMVSALTTAYGDDQGLLAANPAWNLTSVYHMYVQGMTSLFNYGDHGPNKFASTANSLMLWAEQFDQPRYALYQRDQYDSSEPWSMFWYNPALTGAWWDGLPLDRHFSDASDNWVSMRSTWTSNNGVYVAMKSGSLQGHQTHGDLDIGDFVLDAEGQRWAGELGSGQYLSTDYFASEAQASERWLYYRKRTEGQNTILLNNANQVVTANCTTNFGSTGEAQGAAPGFTPASTSTAFYTTDMSQAYNGTSIKRGIRMINGRKQVLLQDDVTGATADVQWRVQTNATISLDSAATTATLSLGGKTLQAKIIQGPSGAKFEQLPSTRLSTDPTIPTAGLSSDQQELNQDQSNGDAKVLAITVAGGGTFSLQVLWNPQVSGATFVTPPNVAIDSWSTGSHN